VSSGTDGEAARAQDALLVDRRVPSSFRFFFEGGGSSTHDAQFADSLRRSIPYGRLHERPLRRFFPSFSRGSFLTFQTDTSQAPNLARPIRELELLPRDETKLASSSRVGGSVFREG